MKKIGSVILLVLALAGLAVAQGGVMKKRPLPYDFGKVIINNYSDKGKLAPVRFDHWLHRSKFTCRVCHVDVGFGMKAGSTDIKAADNSKGYYCGACHNGKSTYNGKIIFESCGLHVSSAADERQCERCHSEGKNIRKEYDFQTFAAAMPKQRFGNGIDWEKAEEDGLIKLVDYIEGVSIKRKAFNAPKDFSLEPKVAGMPEIIFSHKKHAAWNGCELCHPEIFVGVKKGLTTYSMPAIFEGKYCGVCHTTVAFPLTDCQRCHTKPV